MILFINLTQAKGPIALRWEGEDGREVNTSPAVWESSCGKAKRIKCWEWQCCSMHVAMYQRSWLLLVCLWSYSINTLLLAISLKFFLPFLALPFLTHKSKGTHTLYISAHYLPLSISVFFLCQRTIRSRDCCSSEAFINIFHYQSLRC